ncbi:hypothetical protein [[Clostridium] fimetarium]|uniref:Uncharacterized protein n=1 Tax=[Clostridium] fimetarium TaxID=99656 RepID=A0A1I0NEX5_9FIRM|nr:hypothetical protein [[Clostridium] fimetarium]SEV99791.1 hypothetical protein SAMN05421659_10347 [[Clostridium] fimetarium]
MFDTDYKINGIYATYWKELCRRQKRKDESEEEYRKVHYKIFNTYMDCYMAATVLGIRYGRVGNLVLQENKDDAGMLSEICIKKAETLKYIYQLVMILENERNLSDEEKLENAFRISEYDENGNIDEPAAKRIKENMMIFEKYFFGGLEILHEAFVEKCITDDDYIDEIYNFTKRYQDEYSFDDSKEVDIDAILKG